MSGSVDRPAPGSEYGSRDWLDRLERQLQEQYQLAGQLAHGASIGSAREKFLSIALKSILPPAVHLGSGMIVDARGRHSRQIDIIIYDPRFPVLEIVDGFGTYFVEGVIAAIEVKSRLWKADLFEALENCRSILNLQYMASSEQLSRRAEEVADQRGIAVHVATQLVGAEVLPSTYVFGFTGYQRPKALMEAVGDWFVENGQPGSPYFPWLPKAILAERSVGIVNDLWLSFKPIEILEVEGGYSEESIDVMAFFRSDYRFGILVSHLLHAISARLGREHSFQRVSVGARLDDTLRAYVDEVRRRSSRGFYTLTRD